MKHLFITSLLLIFSLQPIISQEIPYLSEADFKDTVWNFEANEDFKYEGDMPIILDFTADWCRPCRLMAPFLDNIQKKNNGKIQIYKINDDIEKGLSKLFGIKYLPTLIFIEPNSDDYFKSVGYKDEKQIKRLIKRKLSIR
jgi:thioredoxin 1